MINKNEEQILRHFDARVDYWHNVYSAKTFDAYMLQKRRTGVIQLCQQTETGGSILDVGCGAGLTCLELVRKGFHVSGIDISPKMIERAKSEADQQGLVCDFRVGVANQLPYSENSFDTVVAMGLVEYVSDDTPVLGEILRVLKADGRFILNMPNATSLYRFIAFPRTLPVILGPGFKRQFRSIENSVRGLLGLQSKDISSSWLGRGVRPAKFMQHLQEVGFDRTVYFPLTIGPFHPFGIKLSSDETDIRRSEKILNWVLRTGHLGWGASTVLYQSRKPKLSEEIAFKKGSDSFR
jgi:2-polyprenyl-3-methyl-5-hydroxy-6-metoxy-1,4-benzoquinol methylase